jgi:thiol:disulfide interchange protein
MSHLTKFGCLLVALSCAHAQSIGSNQVKWSLAVEPAAAAPGSKVLARMTGQIDPGWHLYSLSTPGAIPTTISVAPNPAIDQKFRTLQPPPHKAFDPNFQAATETFEKQVAFFVELDVKKDAPKGPQDLSVTARYQTCNDKVCIPPVKRTATATLTIDPEAPAVAAAIPAGYAEPGPSGAPNAIVEAATPAPQPADQGWLGFLLVAFGFGLATIFTPCVFPMIPITMSYFLNQQSGERRDAVTQAVVFCLGIIVLFSGLGLLLTAIVGPFGIVQLGANPWVNGFIAALFLAFGLSLLGAFEITIPSSVLTRLNQSSGKGGFAGTLIMGLTFSLASFACVGPFVGTLLAASVGGGMARPVAGMVTFAAGLALPFFLLALFPSYLKRLPKSGGWLARVKVVMGFVILGAGLKYLSSVDQVLGWGALTRDRFLSVWIVLAAMAGLYLLGFVRLEGVKPDEPMGLGRLLTGMAFLVFALSLAPGMFGSSLGYLDSYVPAAEAGAGGARASATGLTWKKNQYREALDEARRDGKLVFVNFTGVACANCHWMESNMFPRPEIAAMLKGFVLVDLFTDTDDKAAEENQKLELSKFNTIASPFYAILDANEKVIATFPGRTTNPQEYLSFLKSAATQKAAAALGTATPAQRARKES